jgi:predicted ATPase
MEDESPRLGTWNSKLETPFVGRTSELALLEKAFARARRGERQIIFVSGEAGIGKTTLVDHFLEAVQAGHPVRVGRGQCIEQHGAGEAYLPVVLDALGQLCRAQGGDQVLGVLRRYAPMWLVQLPGLLEAAELETCQRQVYGSSRERMLREFVEVFDRLAAETAIILVFEDLQWSDVSTLELLSYLAQRRGQARLQIIGTYRSADVVVRGHPLRRLVQELHSHGQCEEVVLELLSEEEVEEYLRRRFPGSPAILLLSSAIYNRTDGNALFTVNFVDYLVQQGLTVEANGQWEVRAEASTIKSLVPGTVQRLIAKQLEELSLQEQRLLEIASVVGMSFTAAEVAGATGQALEGVEEVYETLASREQFVEMQGINEWPNRTLTARYGFRHALYQHVVYERVGQIQRVRLHRQVGEWLATACGERAGELASELAIHLEGGRDYQRAAYYRQKAGENALRRNAYQEAWQHLTQGLKLLQTLPETPERKQQELALRVPLNTVLLTTQGYTAEELKRSLQRARELCREVSDLISLVPILTGLARLQMIRADRAATEELMDQERRLIEHVPDPVYALQLHTHLGTAGTFRGTHAQAQAHHAQALSLYNPEAHRSLVFSLGGDPKVIINAISAWSLCLSGWPEQAWNRAERGLVHAEEISHPFSLTVALLHATHVRQFRGELGEAWKLAQRMTFLAREHGFAFYVPVGAVTQGGVLVRYGELEEGLALLATGLAQYRAMGSQLFLPFFLGFLAEAYERQDKTEEGLKVVAEALRLTETNFDRFWEAEVYRLKGQLTLRKFQVQSSKFRVPPNTRPQTPNTHEAEACFLHALAVARQQGAKALELRAAMSLARLWRRQSRKTEARHLLAEIYGWFTEGFDTADLQEAQTLLAELS